MVETGFGKGMGRGESPRSRFDDWKALGSLPSVALSSFQMDESYGGHGCWANVSWDLVCGCRLGCGGRSRGLSSGLSGGSRVGKLSVSCGEDGPVASRQFVGGGDVANRGMQPDGVVVGDVSGDQSLGVLRSERRAWSDGFGLEGLVPAVQLAVGLWVVR